MPARNQLGDLVRQLMAIESALIAGTTVQTLAADLGISTRQVLRHFATLKDLGVDVQSIPGATVREEMTRKTAKRATIFRH